MNEELRSIIDKYIDEGFSSSRISDILLLKGQVRDVGFEQLTYIIDEYKSGGLDALQEQPQEAEPQAQDATQDDLKKKDQEQQSVLSSDGPLSAYMPQEGDGEQRLDFDFSEKSDATSVGQTTPPVLSTEGSDILSTEQEPSAPVGSRRKIEEFTYSDDAAKPVISLDPVGDEFLSKVAQKSSEINNEIIEKRKRLSEIEEGAKAFELSGLGKQSVYTSLKQKEIDELNADISNLEALKGDEDRLLNYNIKKRTQNALNYVDNGRFSGATMIPEKARNLAEEVSLILNNDDISVDQVYNAMVDNNMVIIDEDSVYQDRLFNDLSVAVYDRDNLYKVDYRKAEVPPSFQISKDQFDSSPEEYLSKVPSALRDFDSAKKQYKSRYNMDLSEDDYLDMVSFWNYREAAINAYDQNESIKKSINDAYNDLIKNSTDTNLPDNYYRLINESRNDFEAYNKNVELLGYGKKEDTILGLMTTSLQSEVTEDISEMMFAYKDSAYRSAIKAASDEKFLYSTFAGRVINEAALQMGAGVVRTLDMLQDYEKSEDESFFNNLLYITPVAGAKAFADLGGLEGYVDFDAIATQGEEFARGLAEYDRINMGISLDESQRDISELITMGNFSAATKKTIIGAANVVPQIALVMAAPELAIPMFGLSATGGMYGELEGKENLSYGEKVAYSVLAGSVEAATEYLFKGQEQAIKGIYKNVLKRKAINKGVLNEGEKKVIASRVDKLFKFNPETKTGKAFMNMMRASEEGFEEAIVDIVDQNIVNYLEKKDLDIEHSKLELELESAQNSIQREEVLNKIQANRERYSEIGYDVYRTMDAFGLGAIGGGLPIVAMKSLGYVASSRKIASRLDISNKLAEIDEKINNEKDSAKRLELKREKAILKRKMILDTSMDMELLSKMSEEEVDEIIKLNHQISEARYSSRRLRASINDKTPADVAEKTYESIMKNAEKARNALAKKAEIESRYELEANKIDQRSLTEEEISLVDEIESLDADIDTFESLPNEDGFIDVTEENAEQVISDLSRSNMIRSTKYSTAQQIREGLRNVAKIVKEVKSNGGSVRIFTNKADFERVTGVSVSRGLHQEGFGKESTVSLYLPALQKNTAYHEAFHDTVLRKLGTNQLTALARSLVKAIPESAISKYVVVMQLSKEQLEDVKDLKGYALLDYIIKQDPLRAEEFLVEVLSDITSGDYSISMKKGLAAQLKDFVSGIFGTSFKDPKITDVANAIELATSQMRQGEAVTELPTSVPQNIFAKARGSYISFFSPAVTDILSEQEIDSITSSDNRAVATVEDIEEVNDARKYSEAMAIAIERMKALGKKEAIQVTALSEEDVQGIIDKGGKLFMGKDGMSGGYVMPDGYMGGLFKNPDSEFKGISEPMQTVRSEAGGKFFDAFATKLEPMYIENGYQPIARLDFNEEFAPDGWNDADSPLKGKPDVVFFVKGEGKIGDGVRIQEYDDAYNFAVEKAKEQEEALPPDSVLGRAKKQVIGENADLAEMQRNKLGDAIKMEKEGFDPKKIFIATGWEKGADGKWRMFIDSAVDEYYNFGLDIQEELMTTEVGPPVYDDELGFELPRENEFINKKGSEVIPESILELYPQLEELTFTFYRGGELPGEKGISGNFEEALNHINVAVVTEDPNLEMALESGESIDDIYADAKLFPEHALTIAHEVQHAIQVIEGFQRGTSSKGGDLVDSVFYSYDLIESNNGSEIGLDNIIIDEQDYSDGSVTYSLEDTNEKAIYNLYGVFKTEEEALLAKDELIQEHKKRYDHFKGMFKRFGDLKRALPSQTDKIRNQIYMSSMGEVEARAVEAKMKMEEQDRASLMTSEVMSSVNPSDLLIIEKGISKRQAIDEENLDIEFEVMNDFDASATQQRLRQTIAKAARKYPSLRQELLSNPENYFTPQNLKEVQERLSELDEPDLIGIMTDDGLGRLQNRNDDVSLLAAIELRNRAEARGDMSTALRWIEEAAKMTTTAGRVLRQAQLLKSTTAAGTVNIIMEMIKRKGNTITEEQKERLLEMFSDLKSLDTEYKLLMKEAMAADVIEDSREKRMKDVSKKILDQNKVINDYLNSIVEKGWGDIYTMLVQGNLLTPMSQTTNIFANVANAGSQAWVDLVAYPFYEVLNLFGVASPVKRKYSAAAYLYGVTMGLRGAARTVKSSFTGKGLDVQSEWKMERGFAPMQSLIAALSKKDLPLKAGGKREGKFSVNQRAKLFVQASLGAPAEVMFRALSLGDVPFREYAQGVELFRIARAKGLGSKVDVGGFASLYKLAMRQGLEGEKLRKFLKYPDKESMEFAEEQGLRLTFQNETVTSRTAMGAVNSMQRGLGKFINERLGGAVDGDQFARAIVRTFLPYVKTPANILDETFTYIMPLWTVIKAGKEIKNGDAIAASQSFGKLMVGSMSMQLTMMLMKEGLISGPVEWDEDEEKNFAYDQFPPNSVNVSALKRWIKGEDTAFRPDDEYKNYMKLGIIGQIMAATVISTDPNELKAKNYEDFGFIHHAFTDAFGFDMLSGASSILDQSFLQGIDGILQILTSRDGRDFERSAERLINSVVKAASSTILPNSLSAFARAEREFMPDMRLSKDLSMGEKLLKNLEYIIKDRTFSGADIPIRVDWKGNKVKQTPEGSNGIAYQLFDITKTRTAEADPVSNEIRRLYDNTGILTDCVGTPNYAKNSAIKVPKGKNARRYISSKYTFMKDENFVGSYVNLNTEQINKLMEVAGKERYKHLEFEMNTERYKKASDEDKIKLLNRVDQKFVSVYEINPVKKELRDHSKLLLDYFQEIYEKQKREQNEE